MEKETILFWGTCARERTFYKEEKRRRDRRDRENQSFCMLTRGRKTGCVLSRRIFFAICTREQERDAFHAVCAVIVNVLSGRNFTKKKERSSRDLAKRAFYQFPYPRVKKRKEKSRKREREKKNERYCNKEMSVESRPVVRAHRRWRMTLEGCNTYLYSTLRVYVVNSRVSACTRDFSIIMKKKIY